MNTIIVIGLGPVGLTLLVQAGINHPEDRVIGLDKNEKLVRLLSDGISPFRITDELFKSKLKDLVASKRFVVTTDEKFISHGDTILLAVGPTTENESINYGDFKTALEQIRSNAKSNSLIIVNSTLPIGAIENYVSPILGNLDFAYTFERITPGEKMLSSAQNLSKVISANDKVNFDKVVSFFQTKESKQMTHAEAEMTKLLENSYRAMTISFIHEWTILAEKIGVNLFEVVESIKLRKGTHDNLRSPGAGAGGPCLLKDTMFSILNCSAIDMPFLKLAYKTSEKMHEHLTSFWNGEKKVGIVGLTYRDGIEDYRNSPSLNLANWLESMDCKVNVYDPLYTETCSPQLFTQNCELIFVFHSFSKELLQTFYESSNSLKIVDISNSISDLEASELRSRGHKISGVGKGHWRKMEYHL